MAPRLSQPIIVLEVLILASCLVFAAQDILTLLDGYYQSKDWAALKRGLERVLDKDDLAYRQLQDIPGSDVRPLWWVSYLGCQELAAKLVSGARGANVADVSGNTLLSGAAYGGHLTLAKMLLDYGADTEARADRLKFHSTAIVLAAWANKPRMVELLVKRGADVNGHEDGGGTSLHAAVYTNNQDLVRYLVNAGANLTARDHRGDTPLDLAKRMKHNELAQDLRIYMH